MANSKKEDRMTRDIRKSLRDSFSLAPKYVKGTAQLFLASGKEYFNVKLPVFKSFYDTNKDLMDETFRALRNPSDGANRFLARSGKNEAVDALKDLSKTALEDLKSGKFYDKNRFRSGGLDDAFGDFDINTEDDFGGFDLDGFDENGDWGEPDPQQDKEIKAQAKIAAKQESNANTRTEVTVGAIGASTEAIVTNEKAIAANNLRMSLKQHSQIMNSMQNIVTQQAATFELMNKNLQTTLDVTREAHNQVMDRMKEITSLLTEIRDGVKPKQEEYKRSKRPESMFTMEGALDFKNLFKNIGRNINDKFPMVGMGTSMLSMVTGMLDAGNLKMMYGDNPLKAVSDILFPFLLPKKFKSQLDRTGKNVSSFLPALFQKFGDRGKKFESGEGNLLDMILGMLAPNERSRRTIDLNRGDYLKQVPFTRKTATAIEEVIPMLLSRINANISGGPLLVYDYKNGTFKNSSKVIAEAERSVYDLAGRSGTAYSSMMGRANQYKFRTDKEADEFKDYIHKYLQDAAAKGTFINPYQKEEDFKASMPDSSKQDMYYNLMMGILKSMSKSDLQQMSRELLDARESRDSNVDTLNESLRNSGLLAAWSGLMDKGLQDSITKKSRGARQDLTDADLAKLTEARRNQIIKAGGPQATNVILNDILTTLRKGIITYSFNMGKLDTLPTDGISASARQVLTNARVQQRADYQKLKDFQRKKEDANNATRRMNADAAADPSGGYVGEDTTEEDAIKMFDNFQDILSDDTEMGEKVKKMNENYKKVADQANTGIKGIKDKLNRKVGNSKFSKIYNAPFTLMTKGLKFVDDMMIRVLYGKDAADAAKKGDKSFFDTVSDSVKAQMTKMADWFKEKVGNPLKKLLFDKDDGLFHKMKNAFFEMFGINDLKDRAASGAKNFRDKIFQHLFGTKGEDGKRSGGIFSGTMNQANEAGHGLKDTIKDAVNKLLYGDYKSTKGVGADNYYQDQDGKFVPFGKKKYGGIIGKLKQGFSGVQTFLFGEDDENGNPSESRRKWESTKSEFKKAFPKMTVGAGAGMLMSLFLPGGPFLGALAGSVTGLVQGSDKLKDFLFGKEIVGEDGKPTREGKLISKEVYEGVKKFAPKTLKGALLGGVLGSLGILPFGLGQMAGAAMGAVGGMTSASDQVKKIIFGDNEDKDSGIISKNFREKVKGQLKKFAPSAMVGALAGSGAWSLISGIGLLPGLSMLPGGPILGFLGAATGMANADKFNKLIFGTEEEEEVVDEETGEKKKVKKRKGGIFAGAENFVKDKLLSPFSKKFDEIGKKVSGWFQDNIVGSLKRMSEPLKKGLENAGKSIKESMINIGSKITDAFSSTVDKHVGKPLGEMFKEKFIDPLGKLADKILGGIGKVLGAIISAPFKFLEFMVTGKVGSDKEGEGEGEDEEVEVDENGLPKEKKGKKKSTISEKLEARRKKKEKERADKLYSKRYKYANRFMARHEKMEAIARTGRGGGESGLHYKILSLLQDKDRDKLEDLTDDLVKLKAAKWDSSIDEIAARGPDRSKQSTGTEDEKVTQEAPDIQDQAAKNMKTAPGKAKETDDKSNKNLAQMKDKANEEQKQKNEESKQKTDDSTKKQDDKRDQVQEEKSDRDADNESTNRKNTTRRSRRKRDDNSYLAEIAKNTKNIYREVKGQVNGVGWNTSYIRVLLAKQYGGLSNDELPEEMEGSTIKKRRGFIGKAVDKAKDFFGGIFGGIIGKGKKFAGGVKKVFDVITHPFQLLIGAVKGAGSALKKFGSGILGFLKTVGPVVAEALKQGIGVLGETLKGAAKVISETAKQAISGVGAIIKNGVNMLGQLMGSALTLVRGVAEIAADIFPDIAHLVWGGIKGLGRGIVKGVKGIGKGIGKGVSAIAGKITGKNNPEKQAAKIKKIGTFEIAGGTLDVVKQTNSVKIGDPETSIFMPYVRITRGRVRRPVPYAIPVYVAGSFTANEAAHGDNIGSRLRGGYNTEEESGEPIALPATMPANITGETSVTTSDMRGFIGQYRRVNTTIEASGNPDKAYDRLIRDAKSPADIQAILSVKQLNSGSGGSGGSGEGEKKEGLLSKLKDFLLGGGLGTVLKGFLGAALAAATGVATIGAAGWNLFSDDERANKSHGLHAGINYALQKSGIGSLKGGQVKSFFTDSAARETMVKDAASAAAESGKKGEVKGAKNLLRTSKFLDFGDLVRDTGKLTEASAAQSAKNAAFKEKGLLYRAFHPKEAIRNVKDTMRIKAASGLNTVFGKRAGAKAVKTAVKTGAEEASESATKKAVQNGVQGVVTKLLSNETVAKLAGKFKGKFAIIAKTIAQKVADGSMKNAAKGLAAKAPATVLKNITASSAVGLVVNIGFAVLDFISGWKNTNKYFDIAPSQVTTGMKFTSALINALVGLVAAIPYGIGILASLGLSFFQDSIVQTVYKIIAGEDAANELKEKQEQMKSTLQSYEQKTGNRLTQEQYDLLYNEDGSEKHWYQRSPWGNIKAAWTKHKLKKGDYAVSSSDNSIDSSTDTSDAGTTGSGRGLVTPMSQKSSQYNKGSRVMADAGCGPTSAAMVASAYGTKLNPEKLSKESFGMGMRASDGGLNPSYFSAMSNQYGKGFGMKEGPVDGQLIQSNLAKKQPVVMMGKGGPYGSSMHYMVAESNGGKGKVNVVDPSNGARKSVKGSDLMRNTSSSIYSWGRGSGEATKILESINKNNSEAVEKSAEAVTDNKPSKTYDNKTTLSTIAESIRENPNAGYNEDYDPDDPTARKYSGEITKLDRMNKTALKRMRSNTKVRKKLWGKGRGLNLWGRGTSGNSLAADIDKADNKSGSKAKIAELMSEYYDKHWTRHDGNGWGDWRNSYGGRHHAGIDLCLKSGTTGSPIKSFTQGTVMRSEYNKARGYFVMIKDQYGYQHIYQHLSKCSLKVGDSAKIGTVVGGYGNTGASHGNHLHYEVAKPGVSAPGGYMRSKSQLNAYCVDPHAYLLSYAGGSVASGIDSGNVGSEDGESSGTMVNGIEVDTTSPKGVGLMTTLANVMSKVADPFSKLLNTILMNNEDEEEDTSSSGGSPSSIEGQGSKEANAKSIYKWMKELGVPNMQIAGILSNWDAESGIDPTTIEGEYSSKYKMSDKKRQYASDITNYTANTLFYKYKHGRRKVNYTPEGYLGTDGKYYAGIGVGQFTGQASQGLVNKAKAIGKPWYDLETQLRYATDDSNDTYMRSNKTGRKWFQDLYSKQKFNSPAAAAGWFQKNWEGAMYGAAEHKATAQSWYDKIQSGAWDSTATKGDTNEVKETSTNSVLLGKGKGLTEDNWGAGRGFDPSATWGSAEWGTGAATNLNNLHSTVSNVSSKIASSFSAAKDNSADAIQNLVSALSSNLKRNLKTKNTADNTPSDSDNLALIVTLLSQNLSEMLSTLKDIKTNTERNNTLIQSDTDWKKQTYRTSRADNYASSMSGGQPTNVGSKIVDRLTSK